MSRVNALLFLILKYLKQLQVHKILIQPPCICQVWVFSLLWWYLDINLLLSWSVLCVYTFLEGSLHLPGKLLLQATPILLFNYQLAQSHQYTSFSPERTPGQSLSFWGFCYCGEEAKMSERL
jgi:hypothetical protein